MKGGDEAVDERTSSAFTNDFIVTYAVIKENTRKIHYGACDLFVVGL